MVILFLTSTLDITNGWGRYSRGFLDQAVKRLGGANVIAPDPRKLKSGRLSLFQPVAALSDAFSLYGAARRSDLIHVAAEFMSPLALFLGWMARKPFIISIAGTYGDLRSYPRSVRWLYRLAFRRAACLIALSRFTGEVIQKSVPGAAMPLVHGGFDPPAGGEEKDAMNVPPRILSVGALKPRKGFHSLVAALVELKRGGFAVHCDVVGAPDSPAYFERLQLSAAQGGLTERELVFKGRVSDEELDGLYRRADLFVLPSEHSGTAFEGLGLVYLEALARGVPVIGCLESGAEDVIQDGVNGRLVHPGKPEELAAAIRGMLENPETWSRYAAAARPSMAKFSWDAVGADMEKVYRQVGEGVV